MKWWIWINRRKIVLYEYLKKAKTEKNQILDLIYRKK